MPQQNGTLLHAPKRQKHGHPDGSYFGPAFWDNLSKIDLTKRVLKERDRRSTRAALDTRQRCPQPHRPITRRVLAELKKSCQPLTPAVKYIYDCGVRDLKNRKQTARHGGPDLSDPLMISLGSRRLGNRMTGREWVEASAEFSLMSTGCEGKVTELWPPAEVIGLVLSKFVRKRLKWHNGGSAGPADVLLGSVLGR